MLHAVGYEPGDKDTLEEKRKRFFAPNEKGEIPCWFWKEDDKWERYNEELQLFIELHYQERRPYVRLDADHYIAFWRMKQYRFGSIHKKRRVKRELALSFETQQEIEKEKLAALKGSIQMEEFEDVGEVREPQAGLSASQNATGKFKYRPTGKRQSIIYIIFFYL